MRLLWLGGGARGGGPGAPSFSSSTRAQRQSALRDACNATVPSSSALLQLEASRPRSLTHLEEHALLAKGLAERDDSIAYAILSRIASACRRGRRSLRPRILIRMAHSGDERQLRGHVFCRARRLLKPTRNPPASNSDTHGSPRKRATAPRTRVLSSEAPSGTDGGASDLAF